MPYQVLARKYRPLRFSDVVGQDHVTRTLLNALAQNRIANGYIFSGHRGIGKTTIARILASALNCRNAIGSELRHTPEPCNQCESCLEIRAGNAVDVIEIDAATNRGIDEVRELRDAARYRPSRDKYKIIILDEAHQITDAAFNALLKTLEEPPDHIVFMFATTQPEDIPQTIRSRCQHFSFHAVKLDDIVGQLRKISVDENIDIDDTALSLLAEAGDGSMRDALSIMDQAIASAPLDGSGKPSLTADQIRELMGTVSNVVYEQILEAVHANSSVDVLSTINRLLDAGNGPQQLARQFVRYLRNCTVARITQLSPDADAPEATGIARDLLQISEGERKRAARSAALFTEEELSRFLAIMLRTFDELGYRQEPRFHLELGLLKLVHVQRLLPVEDLLSQLAGNAPATPSSAAVPVRTTTAPAATTARPTYSPSVSTQPSRPSPLEADRNRKTPSASAASSEPITMQTDGSLALASQPAPVASAETKTESIPQTIERPHLVTSSQPTVPAPITISENSDGLTTDPGGPSFPVLSERVGSEGANEAATAKPNSIASTTLLSITLDLSVIQAACVAALEAAKGQSSAAHTIDEAIFALAGDVLEIQIGVSKAMLPTLINAEAERILKATVRQQQAGLKLKLLSGTPANKTEKKSSRPAASGSAQEMAAKHPLVQQAQQLFGAEISRVIDLRDKT